MPVSILKTKLVVPPGRARDRMVQRRRLLEKLDSGLAQRSKLTLVSAPAGFGKTTLLSEWAVKQPGAVAWLSLGREDQEPTQFWSYLIAALETVKAGIGETVLARLFSSQPPPRPELLIELLNAIDASAPRPLVIVLDDYHLIEEAAVHKELAFFLDHLPTQVHMVIATRYDPTLPLSRLRGRGELNELRTADLRFTAQEAATFLNQVMGLELKAEQVSALEKRTEGWIVGLQMAALSMQGRGRQGQAKFITAFTGSHRYVLDYLADEVLLQQSKEVRTFLTHTSILDRLTGSLCDHVCGRSDGQETLEHLESANLFIIPLDDERRWYRYHHLFADLLRKRLGESEPALAPVLHQRASAWYEREKLTADAVRHALAAGDLGQSSRLIGANALAMMEHGELSTLKGWLAAIPEKEVSSQPWLGVAHAWMLAFTGQLDESETLLAELEQALSDSHLDKDPLKGHLLAIRTQVASVKGNAEEAAGYARVALDLLPADDLSTRAWLSMALGLSLGRSGELSAGERELTEAVAFGRQAGDGHVTVLALCNLAARQMSQGELQRAAGTFREALGTAEGYVRRTGRRLPVSGYAHTYLAAILCEWDQLDAALEHVHEGIKLCEQWGEPELLVGGYSCLAEIQLVTDDPAGALDAIHKAEQIAQDLSSFYYARATRGAALVRLRTGDKSGAFRWAAENENAPESGDSLEDCASDLALAEIKLAQERPVEALELAIRALETAQEAGTDLLVIDALILQALAQQALGKTEQALQVLEEALSIAEPEKYVGIFRTRGAPMIQLLRAASKAKRAPDYADRLLAARKRESIPEATPSPVETLVEVLSEREMEVLRLLAAGLSNREIAQELYLSINTIKTHAKSIYGKLGVNRRTQAVSRARELGLL